jgi:hypothetical protein
MVSRSEQLRRLAQQYATRAAAAKDPVTGERFQQEEQHWLGLARKEEEAEQHPWEKRRS